MKLIRSMSIIGTFIALSRILGFVRDILIASLLGASPLADAFFAAFKLPNFFRRLFAEGVLNAAFVPLYARLYTSKGLEKAQHVAEEVFAMLLLILVLFVTFFEVFMPYLIQVLTPGFKATPERMEMTIVFARITFPYILFISLAALIGGILNSHGRFSAASAAPIFLNIIMILMLVLSDYCFETPGHALSFGALIAGLCQFLWVFWASHRAGVALRLKMPRRTPAVHNLFKSIVPATFGAGVVQLNLLSDMMIASFLPTGALSYLYYADRLNQLPLSLIGVALSTALLPILSSQLQQNLYDKALYIQNRALEITLMLTLPASVALMVFSEPLITTLFERKAFQHENVIETAKVLSAFASGLPAYVLIKILSTSFFARYNMGTPAKIGGVAFILNLMLNFLLMDSFKHVGVAMATSISAWVHAAILAFLLKHRGQLVPDDRFKNKFPRILLSSFIVGIFLVIIQLYCPYNHTNIVLQTIILSGVILAALLLYLFASLLTGALAYEDLKRIIKSGRTNKQVSSSQTCQGS